MKTNKQFKLQGQIDTDQEDRFFVELYTGKEVDLFDYGFDHPVVYNISGIKTKQKVAVLYNHSTPIGHTSSVVRSEKASKLVVRGQFSVENEASREVQSGLKKGFPYQASMGLSIDKWEDISFVAEGETFSVNNRSFVGPLYVVQKSTLKEATITPFGRDSDTTVTPLSENDLMTIKNGKPTPPPTPAPAEKETPPVVENKTPEPTVPTPKPAAPAPAPAPAPVPPAPSVDNQFVRYLELSDKFGSELAKKAVLNKWDNDRIEMEHRLSQAHFPTMPSFPQGTTGQHFLQARLGLALQRNTQFLAKKYGEKVVDQALSMPQIGLKELLVECASLTGGRFNGHSDVEGLCRYLRNSQYSTFDMPQLFEGTVRDALEEYWDIDQPILPSLLKEDSQANFKPTKRVRPSGGEMWESLDSEGKIKHTSFGDEKSYVTTLDTKAQLLILGRETIENDDLGVVRDLLDMMVEGAFMVPDVKFLKLAFANASAGFFVPGENDFTGSSAKLTRENLSTIYNKIRKYTINKGKLNWVNIARTRWTLMVDPDLEETAWDIINQNRLVHGTFDDGDARTQGDRNYWFNRLDIQLFPQMGNKSITSKADAENWMLMPSTPKYAAYSISYLRGQRRPTVETVTLPAEMLGFGVRGYWDVEINERENEVVARCRPND